MAIAWARKTFFAVIGKKAPALTVASLAITMTNRPATEPQAGHHPRRGRATPLLIHAEGGKQTQFQELLPGIQEQCQPFSGRQPLFPVLRLGRFCPSALADTVLLLPQSQQECFHPGCSWRGSSW